MTSDADLKLKLELRKRALAQPQVPTDTGMPADPAGAAPVAAPAIPESTWSEALGDMVKNSQGADWKKQFIDPLLSPVDTLNSMGDMADRALENIPFIGGGIEALNDFASEHGAVPGMTKERRAKADENLSDLGSDFGDLTTREGMKRTVAKGIPHMLGLGSVFAPASAGLAGTITRGSRRSPRGMVDNILKNNPKAEAEFNAMNPDTRILADVTGKEGRDLIRNVTKESGEAADALEAATLPRSLKHDEVWQNTVDKIRDDSRIERNNAYDEAYKEGGEIPYVKTFKGDDVPAPFEDLLKEGVARDAYKEAVPKVNDFRRHSGSHGGPLAEIDMTQRILSDAAKMEEMKVAQGKGSATTAKQLRDAATSLKKKADEVMGTPTYARARELGEKNFREIEEFTTKHELEVAKQESTKKAISKALPTEGISLAEVAAALGSAGGLAASSFVPTGSGLAAMVAAGIPVGMAVGSRMKKRGFRNKGYDIGKILSSKEFPATAKRTLIDSILSKSKKVRLGTLPGVLTRDDRE